MTVRSAPALRFVVPAAEVPSGGNTYDRRIAQALTGLGWPVRTVELAGAWPRPGPEALDTLSRVLGEAPDGARVLVDGLLACGVPEVIVPHARRLRLAVLVHLPLAEESGLAAEVARDLDAREREVLRSGVGVIATSGWAARRLTAHHALAGPDGPPGSAGGRAPVRVAVVEPGVDPAPLARGSGFEGGPSGPGSAAEAFASQTVASAEGAVPRLVCVASLTPRKGHDLLFRALAGLRDLPWTCVCAGPGSPPPRPGTGDRIRFTGPIGGAELAELYDSADLLVLASRAETYGMVVTEALARGVPVVATEVGGVPEALGRTSHGGLPGLLVPAEDPRALERALREWLTDPRLRAEVRGAALLRRGELRGWPEAARTLAGALGLGPPATSGVPGSEGPHVLDEGLP